MKPKYLYLVAGTALAFSTPSFHHLQPMARTPERAVAGGAPIALGGASTGGTVIGTVNLDGQAPPGKPIDMSKEPTCAKLHTTPALTEMVVTGGNNGLKNVVVYVSGGLGSRSAAAANPQAVIDQKGCTYHPHVVAMQMNQKLRVVNSDPTSHNIHPLPKINREWNKSQPPGSPAFEEQFEQEEIAIPVKCNIHPWMRGYIAVLTHPHFAVTGDDGTFTLNNLPPGQYTLSAWHEKFGTLTQPVTISGKEAAKVRFVFKPR